MSLKQRLKQQLTSARGISERILNDFHTPDEWLHQIHPGTNHALWFAGHMGQTDNFFITLLDPTQAAPRAGWGEMFGMGSQPTGNPDDYPPVAEVLDYMRDRRQTLLAVLERLSEDELETPTPQGSPEFLADYGMVFQAASWHEGMHTGQLTTVRRSLGHKPIMNPQPVS